MRKIISDVNHAILERKPRINISSLLCCSGGGIPASAFTLGAIQRQVETGEFYRHDVISSASGSTLVCMLIERCYDLDLVDLSSSEWYIKHVVRPLHRFFGEQTLSGVWLEHFFQTMIGTSLVVPRTIDDILSIFNKALFGDVLSEPIRGTEHESQHKRRNTRRAGMQQPPPSTIIKKPLFLYNYINIDTGFVTHDMSDILPNDALRYVKTIVRCCMPVTQINGINAADALWRAKKSHFHASDEMRMKTSIRFCNNNKRHYFVIWMH